MKVFQIRYTTILILFSSLLGLGILVSTPNSSAQEVAQIPNWIKNVSGWWANDEISEKEFLSGIEYLINNNIISLSSVPCAALGTSSTEMVPNWLKNTAGWWSEDLIEDIEFINGLEYLIQKEVISMDNKKIIGDAPMENITFPPHWIFDKDELVFVQSSFFEIYGVYGDCGFASEGNSVWNTLLLGINPNKMDMYNEVAVWNDPQRTAVVYPYFTSIAYSDQGFYDYYAGYCDTCTTAKFKPPKPTYNSSGIGHQALNLLGYTSLTDVDIDKNPSILQQFDKVIILHNEYVTRIMFDAITSHPNVIYLYPNALYAEIEVDYIDETITLIRGHNYPEPEITNGFDWKFHNTHPYEYDSLCQSIELYRIENGWMTNCYPENVFLRDTEQLREFLVAIKDL